jgi:hypothetical protein
MIFSPLRQERQFRLDFVLHFLIYFSSLLERIDFLSFYVLSLINTVQVVSSLKTTRELKKLISKIIFYANTD